MKENPWRFIPRQVIAQRRLARRLLITATQLFRQLACNIFTQSGERWHRRVAVGVVQGADVLGEVDVGQGAEQHVIGALDVTAEASRNGLTDETGSKCGRGLAPDGGGSATDNLADTLLSGASPTHIGFVLLEGRLFSAESLALHPLAGYRATPAGQEAVDNCHPAVPPVGVQHLHPRLSRRP